MSQQWRPITLLKGVTFAWCFALNLPVQNKCDSVHCTGLTSLELFKSLHIHPWYFFITVVFCEKREDTSCCYTKHDWWYFFKFCSLCNILGWIMHFVWQLWHLDNFIFVVQVRLRQKYWCTSSSTRLRFEPMASRSWIIHFMSLRRYLIRFVSYSLLCIQNISVVM